jgi:acetyl esterase/lipase
MGILERRPPPPTQRIPYGVDEFHFGDLRIPPGDGPFPVVMNIHGGFWRAQYSLDHAGHLCAALTQAGIATWNIEYRRIGNRGGGWTGTFEDVGRGADSLRTLAERYPLDVTRALVMGHSAGGHLALWAAARPTFAADHPLYTANAFRFTGVVALAPVADLKMAWQMGLSEQVVATLLGGSPTQQPDRYALASPIELLPLGIPQIVVHGAQDDIVPIAISEAYVQQAQAQGDDCRLERLPAAGHFEVIDPLTPEWDVVQKAVERLLETRRG